VRVSIIIPTLNEAENLTRLLPQLLSLRPEPEIIVVDGGSSDRTTMITEQKGILTFKSVANRAVQLNLGARIAQGDIFLFLHADSWLTQSAYQCLLEQMQDPEIIAGAFRYQLDNSHNDWRERIIEFGVSLRVRFFRLPYGDQGYFVRRDIFEESGGYNPIPLLEDVEWFKRISRKGKVALLAAPLITSARRIHERGWVKSILINWCVILLYALGVSPSRLASLYYQDRGKEPQPLT
jgi:rSAM/selenodomain-associated transferase 2